MIIYIDIETIPGQAPWVKELTDQSVHPPGNISKPETIKKWWKDKGEQAKEDAWCKTALDAAMGEIAVICFEPDIGEICSLSREPGQSEAALLESFFSAIDALTQGDRRRRTRIIFCGHCVLFDLGFIWRRAVINKVRPCYGFPDIHALKPWSDEIIDTCQMWKGSNKATSGSMDVLCRAFGLEGKGDIDGSMVWNEICKGNLTKVIDYCKGDVKRVRDIYRMMTFTK